MHKQDGATGRPVRQDTPYLDGTAVHRFEPQVFDMAPVRRVLDGISRVLLNDIGQYQCHKSIDTGKGR
jgi:hypothetical protein